MNQDEPVPAAASGETQEQTETRAETHAETRVALAALVHLVRLMGAELVAGKHRDDVELLVKAVEIKLRAVQPSKDLPEQDIVRGLELAHHLVRPIFDDLRAQSEKAHLRDQLMAAPTSQIH